MARTTARYVRTTYIQSWQGDHCRSPVHPLLSCSVEMLYALDDQILTMKEVATYLKLAEKIAESLAAAGKLTGFKAGGS